MWIEKYAGRGSKKPGTRWSPRRLLSPDGDMELDVPMNDPAVIRCRAARPASAAVWALAAALASAALPTLAAPAPVSSSAPAACGSAPAGPTSAGGLATGGAELPPVGLEEVKSGQRA